MKTIKTIQTVFLSILFVLSGYALAMIIFLVFNKNYSHENLIYILFFTIPVLMAFIFSGFLISEKKILTLKIYYYEKLD